MTNSRPGVERAVVLAEPLDHPGVLLRHDLEGLEDEDRGDDGEDERHARREGRFHAEVSGSVRGDARGEDEPVAFDRGDDVLAGDGRRARLQARRPGRAAVAHPRRAVAGPAATWTRSPMSRLTSRSRAVGSAGAARERGASASSAVAPPPTSAAATSCSGWRRAEVGGERAARRGRARSSAGRRSRWRARPPPRRRQRSTTHVALERSIAASAHSAHGECRGADGAGAARAARIAAATALHCALSDPPAQGSPMLRFQFPIVIIDEDFRSENTSGLGIRALAAAIEKEGFEVLGDDQLRRPVAVRAAAKPRQRLHPVDRRRGVHRGGPTSTRRC